MKYVRRSALILAAALFLIGLSGTSAYAQRGRYWHQDNGRHLGWYKHNNGRHNGWYKNNRSGRWYQTDDIYSGSASRHYRRVYSGRRVSYGTYHIYRPGQRRTALSTILDSVIRNGPRH
jgi:hypothetical protein